MSEYYEKDFFIKISRIVKAELTNESFAPDPKRIKRIEDRLIKSFGMFDGRTEGIQGGGPLPIHTLLQAHFFRKEISFVAENDGKQKGRNPTHPECPYRHGPYQLGAVVAGDCGCRAEGT